MKFTLSWLKDHLDTEASLADITDALTRVGLEVEGMEDPAERLRGFTVARIVEAHQHPNADRLRVCSVDTGAGAPVQVVCGAPNARSGLVTVFSAPGTYIPGKDLTITAGVIRGVDSNGMLCSASELGLSDEHDGIMELPEDAPVGRAYGAYAGMDDPVIDVALTPNRPDAAGVHGIARDLAALGLGRLKDEPTPQVEGRFAQPVSLRLDFAPGDEHLCPAFGLRLVRGVKNGPSPEWMRRRLAAIGLRPINALVDITNYMTFDRGRPLHVFDAAKVQGDLVVRRAHDGETLQALNGRSYTLDADTVVIADAKGVESIAGIMGGEASGCDETTTDVLIESALWDPTTIAQTGRRLGLSSDARYRFERGVDPAYMAPGLDLATALVLDLCGGEPSEMTLVGDVPRPDHRIDFPLSEVHRLTGLDLPPSDMQRILERLGFDLVGHPDNADRIVARVPSWRPDVYGKADLVEEIVRIAGLDRVEAQPLPREPGVPRPVLTLLQKRTRLAKRVLAGEGLLEAVTWSFVSDEQAALFGGNAPELRLANPIAADLSTMRPSLLPGLLAGAGRNAARGAGDVALFEVGQIFLGDGEGDQRIAAAGLRRGTAKPVGAGRHWSSASMPVGVFDSKADAVALIAALGITPAAVQVVPGGPDWLHPGRSLTLRMGPKNIIGFCGELHPEVLRKLDVAGPVAVFEITLDALPAPKARPTKARPKLVLSDLQPVERDFAFLVDRRTAAADLAGAAQGADRALVAGVTVFDVYEGKGVPEGQKSVAIAVTLQPKEKTLADADLEAVSQKIVEAVAKKTGGVLRG
ncbi:MAG: phenylalanine--tRNA ligase subunit beta [Janthinobacterium lividum]